MYSPIIIIMLSDRVSYNIRKSSGVCETYDFSPTTMCEPVSEVLK